MTQKISLDQAGDALPGSTPEAENQREQVRRDFMVSPEERDAEEFNWVMTGTHVSVHPADDHDVLFGGMNFTDFNRPHAKGKLYLHYRWTADWQIDSTNMGIHLVEKRLKRYTKDQGWEFGSVVDDHGYPMGFPKQADVPGVGEQNPSEMWRDTEWDTDTVQVPYYGEQDAPDESVPEGPRTCSECGRPCFDYDDWRLHVIRDHANPERKPPEGPQPVVDLDDVLPAGFNKMIMDKTVQRQAALIDRFSGPSSAPQIPGPIPFIFDIEQDRIYVGHPGERHSDIKGRFTPGGIIEGLYDPKGNVQIRTDTDMPYTVRHLAELWYYSNPQLAIKGIYLLVGDNKKYRLASSNIAHKVINIAATDPAAWAAFKALEPHGNVYAVGGVVRDVVLGKTPKDVDLMVQGIPAEDVEQILRQLPGHVTFDGKDFGVFRYYDRDGNDVEIALPRKEKSTGNGSKDFEVVVDPFISVGEDLARRDFTCNAMAVNLATGQLIDPYNGAEDLKKGVLDSHNDRAFQEDPLRMLRALAAVSKHALDLTPALFASLMHNAKRIEHVPAERIMMELQKIMKGDHPAEAIELAEKTGLLHEILPEVAATIGFDQKNKHHNLLLHDHLKEVLKRVTGISKDPELRLAALLHDIGKPKSQWIDEDGHGHYYQHKDGRGADHEEVGAAMARILMERLRFPKDTIDRVSHLISHHMFPAFNSMGGARRFLNKVGDEHADDLLKLRWADAGGKGNPWDGNTDVMGQLVNRVRESQDATTVKQLAINGGDLIQAGIKPGPEMGRLLQWLLEQVIEDPSLNNRETLLQMALGGHQTPPDALVGGTGTQTLSSIIDPVQGELDPAVFDNAADEVPTVKPEIRQWVRETIYKILTDAGWPDPKKYLKLIMTGSLTTYQWGEDSDFDVSLWIDTENLHEWVRADLISLMIEKAEGKIVPGTTHPLQAFVVDTTRYTPEDLYKPGLRSGYDLDTGEWVVLPERSRAIDVAARWPEIINYAKMVEDKIRILLRYDKYALKIYWDNIHRRRFLDQRDGKGDYASSNIVYKWLAHRGLFPLISEATGEHIS